MILIMMIIIKMRMIYNDKDHYYYDNDIDKDISDQDNTDDNHEKDYDNDYHGHNQNYHDK